MRAARAVRLSGDTPPRTSAAKLSSTRAGSWLAALRVSSRRKEGRAKRAERGRCSPGGLSTEAATMTAFASPAAKTSAQQSALREMVRRPTVTTAPRRASSMPPRSAADAAALS